MEKINLLIADDESYYLNEYKGMIDDRFPGRFEIQTFLYASEAIEAIVSQQIHVVLTDMNFHLSKEKDYKFERGIQKAGLDIVELAKEADPSTYIIFLSSWSTGRDGYDAYQLGADEVLDRPTDAAGRYEHLESIITSVENAYEHITGSPQDVTEISWVSRHDNNKTKWIIGKSPGITVLYKLIESYGRNAYPVVLTGEVGTGRDLVAEAIHYTGVRSSQPFIKTNCGVFRGPSDLARSSFLSNANDNLFKKAANGTLFLNDYHKLPADLREVVHTVIDDSRLDSLGIVTGRLNVRIITSVPLGHEEIADKGDRSRFVTIEVPPLRDRKEDIPLLIEHYVKEFSPADQVPVLESEAVSLFQEYEWPENVRELRSMIELGMPMIRFNKLTIDAARRMLIKDFSASYSDESVKSRLGRLIELNWRGQTPSPVAAKDADPPPASSKDNISDFQKSPERWLSRAVNKTTDDLSDSEIVGKIYNKTGEFRQLSHFIVRDKIDYYLTGSYYLLRYCSRVDNDTFSWMEAILFLQFWNTMKLKRYGGIKKVIAPNGIFHYFCNRDGGALTANTVSGGIREMKKVLKNPETEKAIRETLGGATDRIYSQLLRKSDT